MQSWKSHSSLRATQTFFSVVRLYIFAGNELVALDWVALLKALRFLDCSANRVSALPTFARALASPTRLQEVVAEGNPVGTIRRERAG